MGDDDGDVWVEGVGVSSFKADQNSLLSSPAVTAGSWREDARRDAEATSEMEERRRVRSTDSWVSLLLTATAIMVGVVLCCSIAEVG